MKYCAIYTVGIQSFKLNQLSNPLCPIYSDTNFKSSDGVSLNPTKPADIWKYIFISVEDFQPPQNSLNLQFIL